MNKTANSPILKVENVSFSYDMREYILKDISFEINEGEILGVLGPNGGGKSTLMKIIAGLEKPTSGELCFFNQKLIDLKNFPRSKVSYVPQSNSLTPVLPVRVNEYLDFTCDVFKIKNSDYVDELLNLVGIAHKKTALISELSGGEKQRVLIARALLNNPKLLLLDEPTKGLDSNGQDQLLNLIEIIRQKHNTAIMIVDHNINQIIKNCQKILCLNRHFHWHDNKDFLTKNILEDIYHCEFEHLLIHEKDLEKTGEHQHDHHFCDHTHDHNNTHSHPFIRRKN